MKLTDLALVFIGITLPIIIVVYVNVSYTIKAEEQEMYYETVINSAIQDTTNQMKEIENTDKSIDYGYSGLWNGKVSVNSSLAVDTFFNSLYNNFGVKGNEGSEQFIQLVVPAIAIVDYNGVQVSSMEKYTDTDGKEIKKHVLKPKKYYSYSYVILSNGDMKSLVGYTGAYNSVHTVEFTMDDYIVHRSYSTIYGNSAVKGFFVTDSENNNVLIEGVSTTLSDSQKNAIKDKVVQELQNKRREVIANTVMDEMSYAVNKNNSYAKASGINYNFTFPDYSQEDWYNSVENVGVIAFVQGLSIGNKYLDYHANGLANLTLATKYYLTAPGTDSKVRMNLYHSDRTCPEYRVSMHMDSPAYATSKQEAAAASATKDGVTYNLFYPCPFCRP